jgi:hypothetical protein
MGARVMTLLTYDVGDDKEHTFKHLKFEVNP